MTFELFKNTIYLYNSYFFILYSVDINTSNFEEDSSLKCELQLYLHDKDSSLTCLKKYPTILQAFLRSNTPLTSSGPVERLFSFAGIILTPRRQCLTDDNFEKMVLFKANNKFF